MEQVEKPRRSPYKPSKVGNEGLVEPCACAGKCQAGRDPEYCANWLARTFHMTVSTCTVSGAETWHRNGVCTDCYPVFPTDMEFVRV